MSVVRLEDMRQHLHCNLTLRLVKIKDFSIPSTNVREDFFALSLLSNGPDTYPLLIIPEHFIIGSY